MDTIEQYLTNPMFLGFAALILIGFFLPQVKRLLAKLKLPSKPDIPIKEDTLGNIENLAKDFAWVGDEENTMLAIAMMKGIIEQRGIDLLQLCKDCKEKHEEEEQDE